MKSAFALRRASLAISLALAAPALLAQTQAPTRPISPPAAAAKPAVPPVTAPAVAPAAPVAGAATAPGALPPVAGAVPIDPNAPPPAPPPPPLSDIIFTNGEVLTLDDKRPTAQAVAIKGSKIIAVGKSKDILARWKSEGTEVVDLAGKTLVPGFIDSWGQMSRMGLYSVAAQVQSPPEGKVMDTNGLLRELREWGKGDLAKRFGWIIGFGYDDTRLREQRPRRHEAHEQRCAIAGQIAGLRQHQELALAPHLSVADNLAYGRRRAGAAAQAVALDTVVDLLGIGALMAARPATLSGGERQRVAIARALATGPRLLLLDEPLAALDAARKAEVLPYLERLQRTLALPMVYVTHALDETARLADHLVLMDRGRVQAAGPLAELLARPELPLARLDEAGSVIHATVERHEPGYALTRIAFDGGALWVGETPLPPGEPVRARVLARDVSVSRVQPTDTSVLNVLPARLHSHSAEAGARVVRVELVDGEWC